MNNIIKLKQNGYMDSVIDEYDYEIAFIDPKAKADEIIDALIKVSGIKRQELSRYDILENTLYENHKIDSMLKREFYSEWEENIYGSWSAAKEDMYEEMLEYLVDKGYARNMARSNHARFSTVGYSQWAYYIAYEDVSSEFALDLWEGWNWYTMELIKSGEVVDTVSGCYIPNEEALDDYVGDFYGLDDYYLVDNSEGGHLDRPKVKEVKHITYEYELVKSLHERRLDVAEDLGWSYSLHGGEIELSKFSDLGQDFHLCLDVTVDMAKELDKYIDDYDISYEAYLWLDDTGHGKNGAPYEMIDVYRDMENCLENMEELLEAWRTA